MRELTSGLGDTNHRGGIVMKFVLAFFLLLFATALGWFIGSNNPYTPAGYVGYVFQKAVFGKAKYLGTQAGPTSWGRKWMADVVNVSITPYTYSEEFTGSSAVLAKDDLKIEFRVHILFQVDDQQIQQFVEKFSTLRPTDTPDQVVQTAYDNCLKEPLRTYSRAEVQTFEGLQIKNDIPKIGDNITQKLTELAKGTPFKIKAVVIGNIQYPEAVANSVALKLAATQRLEQQATEAQIKKKEAEGIAAAMKEINNQLTPQYLQYQAIESQKLQVNSPNHTVIYIPVGPMGVPVVGAFDVTTGGPPAQDEAKK